MRHYHDTLDAGEQLPLFEAAAASQDALVLKFLRAHPANEYTAHQLHQHLFPHSPRTSAGRALSNLKLAGLVHVPGQCIGPYQRPVFLWKAVARA